MTPDLPTILQARDRIAGRLHRTPLVSSATLSRMLGARVSLKLECLQKTGSFKPRGAFNTMLSLTDAEKARGIVAVSGGNHAQGVAYAAGELGLRATICMPKTTPSHYLDATCGYGAEVVLCEHIRDAFDRAEAMRRDGMTLVHPFDDVRVMAGQGTVGVEIMEDAPDATHVFVSIGGGGLIAGVAAAVKAMRPATRIVGVETRGADAMAQAVAAGRIVELPGITSIARTLGAPAVSQSTLDAVRALTEGVEVVGDDEAVSALVTILERCKILCEPAASCVLAAAMRRKAEFTEGDHVVLLLCGGNVTLDDVTAWRRDIRG